MNKTAIKNFAIWARNKLIADISYRAGLMGITAEGIHDALSQSTGQTEFYDIGTAEPYAIKGEAIRQRSHLVDLIQRKEKDTNYKTAYKYIIEEVAYTWFNRLIAVRFMEVNDYLPSHIRVLSSDTGKLEPDLVTTPFDAELEFTIAEQQEIVDLKNANKLDEVFRMLFIKQCNALNEILPALFEKTNDYTELLLNLSVIDQDGVVYHLVHDIPEKNFDVERGGQVEIIGWLYQYYNTEPKNEAFSKKDKISKEEVPAVTQLFTPDWIVRYMVENSLGRLWVEGHPNEELKAGWRYYLEEAEQEMKVQAQIAEIRAEYARLNPKDIKIIDPCMGSGHILVYAFDVLMQIYESSGYGQRDAARSILENNLYGLDIDDRAFQMAYFSVMMKARQYNRRILNGEYKPNVYSIQESNGIKRNQIKYFGAGLNKLEKDNAIMQMAELLDTFKDAKEYGSILTVDSYDWNLLDRFVSGTEVIGQMSMDTIGLDDTAEKLKQLIAQGRVLEQKYHVTITNPPYMSISNGSRKLNEYVLIHFPNSKADLFACFFEQSIQMTRRDGFLCLVTMQAWMFLSSYEKIRNLILQETSICTLMHMENMVLGIAFGTAVTNIRRAKINDYKGVYNHIKLKDIVNEIPISFPVIENRNNVIRSEEFYQIPGSPIAYWVKENTFSAFRGQLLGDYGYPKQGFATGNNDRFLRLWFEVDYKNIEFSCDSAEKSMLSDKKWYPCNKGGEYRKWYGNNNYVADWWHDGVNMRSYKGSVIRNPQFYFREGITWSSLTNGKLSMRYSPKGFLFESKGSVCFMKNESMLKYILGLMNSRVVDEMLLILSPTVDYHEGPMSKVPIVLDTTQKALVESIVETNIVSCKAFWDANETSWEFKTHPFLKKTLRCQNKDILTIEERFRAWSDECDYQFELLRANEEKLNSIFIDIYGLQDELMAKVADKDVSVRRADLQRDIKSLLSYAVGCMFGRYSLDATGLIYAGGGWSEEKYGQFKPDVDNIIPISDEEYLEDDIISRLCEFLKAAFGEGTLEENLNFIAKALGNKGESSRSIIRNYFLNDFFKDHCQKYSVSGSGKRPIYWLFDSGKQNGFKALIYLHRYDADTIGNLRIDYLHRMQRIYESEISRMQDMIDQSTNTREIGQAIKRRDKLTKQLKECREFDEKLAHLALSRIELNLDEGVKVNYRKLQTANDGKFYEVLADSKKIMAKK